MRMRSSGTGSAWSRASRDSARRAADRRSVARLPRRRGGSERARYHSLGVRESAEHRIDRRGGWADAQPGVGHRGRPRHGASRRWQGEGPQRSWEEFRGPMGDLPGCREFVEDWSDKVLLARRCETWSCPQRGIRRRRQGKALERLRQVLGDVDRLIVDAAWRAAQSLPRVRRPRGLLGPLRDRPRGAAADA